MLIENEEKNVSTEDLIAKWKETGDNRLLSEIIKNSEGLIQKAIKSYAPDMRLDKALRIQSKLETINAIKSYDPKYGKFSTHLLSRLQRIHRLATRRRQIVSTSESLALGRMQLENARHELLATLGREPSDQELADSTGLSMKMIQAIRKMRLPVPEAAFSGSETEDTAWMPSVKIPGQVDTTWIQLVYLDQDPIGQAVMERFFGLHGHTPKRPGEIAQELKLQNSNVSRILSRIWKQIEKANLLQE